MLTLSLPTIVALFIFSSAAVRATPCIAFDVNWNLLAFGLDGKDWNAGTQDTWASGASQNDFFSLLSFVLGVDERFIFLPSHIRLREYAGTATDITASGRP